MTKVFNTTASVKEGANRTILRGIIQYDTMNMVNIRLTDGSKAFNYDGYTNIVFRVLKADGTAYIDSEGENIIATSPVSGIVTVILKGQATTAVGLCQGVIEIYAEGEKMTSARLNYEVFSSLDTHEAAESENQYPVFQKLLSDLSKIEADATAAGGYATRAEIAAKKAEMWAKGSQNSAEGDFATRAELEAVKAGAAPAGFGYGEARSILIFDDYDGTKFEESIEDLFVDENAAKVFRIKVADYPACIVSGNGGYADIYVSNKGAGLAVYYGIHSVGTPAVAIKQKFDGVWYPWEYVNPPMLLGVEYRTTERHLGRPVFTKVLQFDHLPTDGTVVKLPIAENEVVVHVWISNIVCANSNGINKFPTGDGVPNVEISQDNYDHANAYVQIRNTGSLSGFSGTVTLKYTKPVKEVE